MKLNQRNLPVRWLSALLCCLPVCAAYAGSVSGVSGNVANGSVVTITGSGFGSKANAKPLYFWDFSNSTSTSALGRTTYTGPLLGTLTTSLVAPGSTHSLQNDVAGVTSAFGPGVDSGVPFSSTTLYVWAKKYYAFNIATDGASNGLNLKFFRLWANWTNDVYTGYQGSMGLNSGRTVPEQTQTMATWWTLPQESGRWLVDEWEYQAGDVDASNGVLNYARDGVLAYPRTTRFSLRTSSMSTPYNHLFFDQISNNELSPGKYLYFDSIYVDDTWQRVIISDEATWQNAVYSSGTKHKREIQIPAAWSDGSIQVTLRQGSLGTLAGNYLYVIGPDGNPVNPTGFKLGGTTTKLPNPPTSVTVQ